MLGVPWYGYRYECVAGTSATATTCPIPQVPFRGINCSDAAGSEVGLSDILSRLPKSTTGRRWDDYQAAPYFNTVEGGTTVQYWYDDVQSLTPKYARARELGLRGVLAAAFSLRRFLRAVLSATFPPRRRPATRSKR